jgi:hypothetical protein
MLIAICLAAATTTAAADPPKHLPPGERINKGKPDEKQCYTFPEFKILLKVDNALTVCQTEKKLLEKKTQDQAKAIADLTAATKLQAASITDLKAENKRLFKLWKTENKKRHEAENKPRWGSWFGWGTAGVMTVATAILVTVIIIDD